MSAFSNWNGPGCGGGPTLPQVTTLEQLISQLATLSNQVNQINQLAVDTASEYSSHTNDSNAGSKHQSLSDNIAQANTRIDTLITNLQSITLPFALQGQWADTLGTLRTSINNNALLTAEGLNEVDNLIEALEQSVIGFINNGFIDFRNMQYIRAPNRNLKAISVNGTLTEATGPGSGPRIVAVLGYLSSDWTGTNNPLNTAPLSSQAKAATAYVKFVDDDPWDAVIDVAATYQVSEHAWTGSIDALVSQTPSRDGLTFHLVKGTTTIGNEVIYLAVETNDVWAQTRNDPAQTLQFFVSGINFVPTDRGQGPNGQVISIASSKAGINSYAQIMSDQYLDADGNGVAVTDSDASTLTIGNDKRQLVFMSTDRPTIVVNGTTQRLAYVSDTIQSMFFQQTVQVIVDKESDLTGLTSIQVSADATTPYSFKNGDKALVIDVGTKQYVPDAFYNGIIESLTSISVTSIIGDTILVGTIVADTSFNGTSIGGLFKITAISGGNATIQAAATGDLTTYTLPGIATFTEGTSGSAGTWGDPEVINLPATPDGHLNNASFQYVGNYKGTSQWYMMTTAIWTPHYEDDFLFPDREQWSFVTINQNGFYTSSQLDALLEAVDVEARIQADWADSRSVVDGKANPAFIQNKPWTGIAILDPGTFINNIDMSLAWVVDGGDFSEVTPVWPNAWTQPYIQQTFTNSIIRTFAGLLTAQPETLTPIPDGSPNPWVLYTDVLRIRQQTDPTTVNAPTDYDTVHKPITTSVTVPASDLAYNDRGKEIYRFVPFNDKLTLKQYIPVTNAIVYAVPGTNNFSITTFSTDNSTALQPVYNIARLTLSTSVYHVQLAAGDTEFSDLVFTYTQGSYTDNGTVINTGDDSLSITIPRLEVVDQAINQQGGILDRLSILEGSGGTATLPPRVAALETVVGNTSTPQSGLLAQVATNITAIATNLASITTLNGQMTTAQNNITTLTTDITTINGQITTINGQIATLEAVQPVVLNPTSAQHISGQALTIISADSLTAVNIDPNGWITAIGIQGLIEPTNDSDATSKAYVDSEITGVTTTVNGINTRLGTAETNVASLQSNVTTLLEVTPVIKNPNNAQTIVGESLIVSATDNSTSVTITPTGVVTGLIAPVNGPDAVNKTYVDSKLEWMTATIPVPPSDGGPYVLQWDPSTSSFSWRQ